MKTEALREKTILLLIGLLTIVFFLTAAGTVKAGLKKTNCYLCHEPMGHGALMPEFQGTQGCVNCHSSSVSSTIYDLTDAFGNSVTVPVVNYTGSALADDAPTLAGGNFFWVQTDDTKGHNIFSQDGNLAYAPGDLASDPITCGDSCHQSLHPLNPIDGEYSCEGCHIDVLHHSGMGHAIGSEAGLVTSALEGWYRFLFGHDTGAGHGVEGYEDGDWQTTFSSIDHNEYLGSVYAGGYGFALLGHTTTAYCTGCHGSFHADQGTGSPWPMHPSDWVIPNSGEFATAFGATSGTGTYNVNVPVARPDFLSLPTDPTGNVIPSGDVTLGTDMIMCLSCHTAHGSPYPKMLRGDYDEACNICHTSKADDTYPTGAHGNPDTGVNRPGSSLPTGHCAHCHSMHSGNAYTLFEAYSTDDKRSFCLSCHDGVTAPAASEPPADHGESSTTPCVACHNPHDPAHGGGEGTGCKPCHGHDEGYVYDPEQDPSQGAGTYQSHSTHTEGDDDDLKGPMEDCSTCHDTNNYPYFKSGTGDAPYDVSETDVCDGCHSGGGAFPGAGGLDNPVTGAKANWATGVYAADGTTLQSGKEQWCATCHDDAPASSRPGPGIEVVTDTLDAVLVCEWTYVSGDPEAYGSDYYWYAAGDGSCTATWTPDLPDADNYNVYAWWKASSNRATNAKYTIYYDGGSQTVVVNQEVNGGKWNYLGTFPFAGGTSGSVVLSNDADEYVIADAIKLDNGSLEVSINAPNISGDNATFGFYINGHNINCLSCHDASKKHIDHEHRTYDVDDATYAAINPYGDSYRLSLPSNKASSTLCFVCHNSTEVLGQNSSDVSHTNFWNDDSNDENSHWLHVVGFTGVHFDSDWDGTIDSTESCITCHNVHGAPTQAMIRHGELISSYGTTDKIPALNFAYLVEPTEFDTATWTPDLAADTYSVYAWWKAGSNRATNAKYTIYYDDGSESVEVNQQINGDQWNLLGTFPFAAGTSGYVELTDEGADGFVIADAVGWDTDGGAPDTIIDDGDPEFAPVGTWGTQSTGGYQEDYQYARAAPEPDPDATVDQSVGGRMSYAGSGVGDNGVCWACHGAISYTRTPYLGPKVIMGQAAPDTVANDGSGTSLITVFVSDTSVAGVPDVDTVEIDLSPIGGSANQPMNNDGGGYYSYGVTIPDTTPDSPLTFVITATDDAANTAEGQAKLTVVDPDSIYVDNPDAQFVCDWGASGTGGYRDDYRWHAAGTGSCTATWTPGVPAADTYSVYAWWKASANRATDAPYTIYYDGGSETIRVNQEINGSQWNYLGNFPFAAGTSGYVVLSDDADEFVIADAVKFEP